MTTKLDLFVTLEIAVLAKQAGFKELCLTCYSEGMLLSPWRVDPQDVETELEKEHYWFHTDLIFLHVNLEAFSSIAAPTWGQLEDWLRIEHNQYAPIVRMPKYKGEVITGYTWAVRSRGVSKLYDTYEDARLDLFVILLKRVIENG